MSAGDSSDGPDDAGGGGGPGAEDERDPLIGRVIADRYRIDERLGVGGMGAVYRAEHVLMRKPVAVKVLHREMTLLPEVVKRFEREAIAAGRIDHPHVTVATDFGKLEDGAFYLVLEFVPGRSLTRAMEEDGAFPVERALFVARQIASALGAAHAADIVHRDLKPDNVMLIERGGTKDFVKVLDFGIAKVNAEGAGGSQLTRLGSVFGTPAYMAPEQAAGKPVDGRADLYSLGLVLYEMIAGRPAFEAEELVALLTKQLTEPPPPLPPHVDAETRAVVDRLVEKDPPARFADASALVAAIDARLGPLVAPPESTALGVRSVPGSVLGVDARGPASQKAAAARTVLNPPEGSAFLANLRAGAGDLVARTLRGDTLHVLGRDVPLRAAGLGALALLVVVVAFAGVLARGRQHPGGSSAGPALLARADPESELSPVRAKAAEGDRGALKVLEAVPESERSAAAWAAIARGRSKLGDHTRAVEAVARAVARDGELVKDAALLQVVRRGADDDGARKPAMELARTTLGAGGADVLFDVWAATVEKTEATTLAKSMLDRDDVRDHASPALRLALDLRRSKRCDELKRLVDVAVELADERAFRPLNQLMGRSGCGFLGLADCYPCLRQGDALAEALKAAQQRKGPRF